MENARFLTQEKTEGISGDVFEEGKGYSAGDHVIKDGVFYVCTTSVAQVPVYSSSSSYEVNDKVRYPGDDTIVKGVYKCRKQAEAGSTFDVGNNGHWDRIEYWNAAMWQATTVDALKANKDEVLPIDGSGRMEGPLLLSDEDSSASNYVGMKYMNLIDPEEGVPRNTLYMYAKRIRLCHDTDISGTNINADEGEALTTLGNGFAQLSDPTEYEDEDFVGKRFMYVGNTTASLTKGYVYECKYNSEDEEYYYERVDVQPQVDVSGKQDKSNLVTSFSATTSNDKYPSEKLVKDSLDAKITDPGDVLSDKFLKKSSSGTLAWSDAGSSDRISSGSNYVDATGKAVIKGLSSFSVMIDTNEYDLTFSIETRNTGSYTFHGGWFNDENHIYVGYRETGGYTSSSLWFAQDDTAGSGPMTVHMWGELSLVERTAGSQTLTLTDDISHETHTVVVTQTAGTDKTGWLAIESDVSGRYVKPAGGIPKSDLALGVRTSLGKADTAVQSLKCGSGSSQQTITPVSGVADLSNLFTRVDTLTPVSVAGVLNNAELEKSIVKAVSSNFTDADTTSY